MNNKPRLATVYLIWPIFCLTLLVGWAFPADGAMRQDALSASIELVDIASVEPDLTLPPLSTEAPLTGGKRFKQVLPTLKATDIHHVVYLPTDWTPTGSYPVIVEYVGNGNYRNKFGDVCTGKVTDGKLGYGISGGKKFIWVCLPFINEEQTKNAITWWGNSPNYNPQPTVDYCKRVVPWICQQYGGDPERVVLTGFSRGAIACNFIGLYDDDISKLWCGFIPCSHYDGVSYFGLPQGDRNSARQRLDRLDQRPQFICAETPVGKQSVESTRTYLQSTGVMGKFTFQTTGFRNHNDSWILRPSPSRKLLRTWVEQLVQ
jgi:hypothetical protein